MVSPR
jgi:phenol 2-monooxygenase